MKPIQRLTLCALFVLCSLYANAYDFSAKNDDGVLIYYNILDSEEKTCEVTCESYGVYSGEVNIPSTTTDGETTYIVTSVGYGAFYSCSNLTTLNISDSVISIEERAISHCQGLTSLTLGNNVTSIGRYAFEKCTSLKTVTLGNSVITLGYGAFYQCSSLNSIVMGSGVESIGDHAFYECSSLVSFEVAGDNQYFCDQDGVLFTKDMTTLIQFPLASPLLPSYDIPDGVTTIGDYAFYDCTGLKTVNIPSSVNTIDVCAFFGCTVLTSFNVADDSQYFCDQDGVLFTKDMTTLVQFPLASPLLPSYDIPDGVTTIGDYAFNNCSSLTGELKIPDSVTSIGDYAFNSCSGLTSLILGNSVTSIGDWAFYNCTGLTGELKIPNSVTTIGDNAFYFCIGLTGELKIPDSVTSIGSGAFYWCDKLTSLTIGEGVTIIRAQSFAHCENLTSVIIPNGVITIEGQAFAYCSNITSLTLGNSVEMIFFHAFNNCQNLNSIYSLNPTPPDCDNQTSATKVFDGVDKETCVLYVPVGSKEIYSSTFTWEDFYTIIEMTEFSVETLATTEITDSSAILNGSVTEGYDEPVSKRGFEYWKEGSENVVTTINLDENDMSYTLEDLASATTYIYRAFATTEDGTTYGEDVAFTTLEESSSGISGIYSDSGEVEGIYSTSGQKLNALQHGVNIVKYSDGSTKKVLVK